MKKLIYSIISALILAVIMTQDPGLYAMATVAVPAVPIFAKEGGDDPNAQVVDSVRNLVSEFRDKVLEQQKAQTEAQKAEIQSKLNEMHERFEVMAFDKPKEEKISARFDEMAERMERMAHDVKRGSVRGGTETSEFSAHMAAMNSFLRTGEVTAEQKDLKIKLHPNLKAEAMFTFDGQSGGFLVPPPTFIAEINKEIVDFAPIWDLVRRRPADINGLLLPKRNESGTAYWKGEGEENTPSGRKYGEDLLPVHELTAETEVSNRSLENPVVNVEADIAEDFGEQYSVSIAAALIGGNGVNKPVGIIGNGTAVNSGSITLSADALFKLNYGIKSAYRRRGTWLANRQTYRVIRQLLAVSDGNFLWQPGLQAGEPSLLLGNPVAEAPELPAPQANGNFVDQQVPILFGDYERGYTAGDGISFELQRDPFTKGSKRMTVFRGTRYIGGKVTRAEAIAELKITTS